MNFEKAQFLMNTLYMIELRRERRVKIELPTETEIGCWLLVGVMVGFEMERISSGSGPDNIKI